MSGVTRAVSRTFSRVTNVVRRVAPIALAAGAIIFTAGAALGAAPLAAGWGGAMSSVVSSMGATGVLNTVLTGALTQAGYGAVMGGVTSALTGGSVSRGMQMGALGGAASGAAMGALGLPTDPLASRAAGEGVSGGTGQGLLSGGAGADDLIVGSAGNTTLPSGASVTTDTLTSSVAGAPSSGTGLLAQGGWLERNQGMVGNLVSGVGRGLLAGESERSAARAQQEADQRRFDFIDSRWSGSDAGLITPEQVAANRAQDPQRPTPAQRFDPRNAGGMWQYDRNLGRIVYVTN